MNIRLTLAAAALGLALASPSNADTIYVTGSTAFRTAFTDAVYTLMTANSGTCTACYSTPGTEGFRDATRIVFSGNINGVPTTIKTVWNGSVIGIQALANPASLTTPLTYLPGAELTQVTRGGVYPAYTYTGAKLSAETPVQHDADIGMSDVFQTSTTFTSPVLTYDKRVAVIPFIFVGCNNIDDVGIDNITPLQAQLLWGAGRVSLSLFTGNSADNKDGVNPGKEVFAFGRNNDSGTRLTMLAEMGKGATSGVIQYTFDTVKNEFKFATPTANNGVSGSAQATQLSDPDYGANVGYAIGMLGLADAAPALTAGAQKLKWNGVPFTEDNVRSGKYSVWGYEHVYVRNGAPTITPIADTLVNEMRLHPGEAGIVLSTMNVQRSTEGGLIDLND